MNELTARDATNLTYDDNGNLTDDGTSTYAYDALNRLIKVTRKSDSAVMADYAYDALGRRIWRKADEDQSGSQETELYYVHDGNREIEERVYSDEDLKRDYVYGNYIDEPIFARADKNDDGDFGDTGEQFYYAHNNLYNVAVLLDTSGNIIESYAYKPYGKPTIYTGDGGDGDWFDGDETTGSLTGNYYLFTGKRFDPESDLFYYGERYYSPESGRFLQRDPIFDVNLYWYVFDNPGNFTDPRGRQVNIGQSILPYLKEFEYPVDSSTISGSFFAEVGRAGLIISANPPLKISDRPPCFGTFFERGWAYGEHEFLSPPNYGTFPGGVNDRTLRNPYFVVRGKAEGFSLITSERKIYIAVNISFDVPLKDAAAQKEPLSALYHLLGNAILAISKESIELSISLER